MMDCTAWPCNEENAKHFTSRANNFSFSILSENFEFAEDAPQYNLQPKPMLQLFKKTLGANPCNTVVHFFIKLRPMSEWKMGAFASNLKKKFFFNSVTD